MKINTSLSLFTAGALLSASFLAYAHNGGAPASEYDANGDGVVTAAEILAVKTADFTAADVDNSGALSLAEYLNLENTLQTRRIAAAFAKMDVDLDSNITLAEFTASAPANTAAYLTNVFKLADKNADAGVSLAEFTELQSKGANGGVWEFARLDASADQLLSLDEYTAVPAQPTAPTASAGGERGGKAGKR
ncbi:MAG: hypothetical protein HZT40_22415 [Candidatus Thiothrix singaporensis]|uniref:EF-hand domain-containing protein n=1 Tax=Candidatus Thiothrix singaporensis TaxID=2799669 RepID=A0A7L6AYA0_9GAMM|nr:MAG: hypothetical protein HZT40_22415 [Candidatus Thiothrix singaporensis]